MATPTQQAMIALQQELEASRNQVLELTRNALHQTRLLGLPRVKLLVVRLLRRLNLLAEGVQGLLRLDVWHRRRLLVQADHFLTVAHLNGLLALGCRRCMLAIGTHHFVLDHKETLLLSTVAGSGTRSSLASCLGNRIICTQFVNEGAISRLGCLRTI